MIYNLTEPLKTEKLKVFTTESLSGYMEKYKTLLDKRLREFQAMRTASEERIFYELCYCIYTPQSNAVRCDEAVHMLSRDCSLEHLDMECLKVERASKKARFWRTKSKRIIEAWGRYMSDGTVKLMSFIKQLEKSYSNQIGLRNRLREEFKGLGLGMKETSHFLRNIGFGENIAIIDRHILSCLAELRVIDESMSALKSDKDYLWIEKNTLQFSGEIGIPSVELDLIFWSAKTGFIYK